MEEQKSVSKSTLELAPSDGKYQQYVDTMQRMQFVVNTMREEPSPAPQGQHPADDASVITHCVFPPAGGVLTYLARYEQPFRGFPFNDTVQEMDELKKLAKIILQKFLPYIEKASLFGKLRFLLATDHIQVLAKYYLFAYHWHVKRYRLKFNMYCQPLREMWQVIDKSSDAIGEDELREAIRDGVCMFLEFDNAYRYRFQDILSELDKEKLKKDVGKEVIRLFDLLIEREVHEPGKTSMADKWKMLRKIIYYFLKFNPKIKATIRNIFLRVNLSEIDFSIEDRYYCSFRKDYKFGFMMRENLPIREVPKGSPIQVEKTVEIKQ